MHKTEVSIWFFNGVMLTVYGLMIGGYGVYELISGQTPPVVLAHLHAPVWWGGLLSDPGAVLLREVFSQAATVNIVAQVRSFSTGI